MINLTRKEAQQVLEGLENIAKSDWRKWEELADPKEFERWVKARANHMAETLRARLSAPEPEPVAWMNESDMGRTDWKVWAHGKPTATIPLYAAPPQREWQGLTDEEREEATGWSVEHIEAKLKEKNT